MLNNGKFIVKHFVVILYKPKFIQYEKSIIDD